MNKEKFVGTWKLRSFEVKLPDGSVEYPYGKSPVGYLVYSLDGYMSAVIMDKDRENFNSVIKAPIKKWWRTIESQKKSALETFFHIVVRMK